MSTTRLGPGGHPVAAVQPSTPSTASQALTEHGQLVFGSSPPFLTENGVFVFQIPTTTTGLTENALYVFSLPLSGGAFGGPRSMSHFWLGGASGLAPAPGAFGGPRSMAHFWMGGAAGVAPAPVVFGGPISMAHFWMGGAAGVNTAPPGGGFIEPPYFIVNVGRMMNRRGI